MEFQSGFQNASDYRHGGQPAAARDQSDSDAYRAKQYECAIAALQSGQVEPVNKVVQEGFLASHQSKTTIKDQLWAIFRSYATYS